LVNFLPRVKVAEVDEFPPGTKKSIKASKTRILLVNASGKIYATQSLCTHLSNPLFTGKLQGNLIWCDKHWASFDVTNGLVKDLPEGGAEIAPLKTYPVHIDGSDIMVDVPD